MTKLIENGVKYEVWSMSKTIKCVVCYGVMGERLVEEEMKEEMKEEMEEEMEEEIRKEEEEMEKKKKKKKKKKEKKEVCEGDGGK